MPPVVVTPSRTDLVPPLGVSWLGKPGASVLAVAIPIGPGISAAEFCLVDRVGETSTETRFALPFRQGNVLWGHLDGIAIGATYGIRVSGANADPSKLLVDPYAKALTGNVDWLTVPGAHRLGSGVDTSSLMPLCVVTDPNFDWGADDQLNHPWDEAVIYEVHVKNATKLHPDIPEHLRGTYAGLAHPAFVSHLHTLGVTAVELLPVHHHVDEERLAGLGLTNHWGYNTLGFFAPDHRYSASGSMGEQLTEFKGMVKLLHEANLEVLLDVVYNHTGEGGWGGAALSLRGVDPSGWYREPDVTGCGNTLDLRQPAALQLTLESLRYWVNECHVDGFRFDLAPAMCRTDFGFSQASTFLAAVHADPVLSRVKLISEPWDIGVGGYQLGSFPAPWTEWNDRFRDTIRDLWCGKIHSLGEVAERIAGSSGLFAGSHRSPWASINFVAAHDGMTTADLCAYNNKHNDANGEGNRDGTDNNRSWNCGVEGPSSDPAILALRARQRRNLLATLALSRGVPMFVAGDEVANSQQGNNNAYCQDNEISWIDWASADWDQFRFLSAALRLRAEHPILRDNQWMNNVSSTWLAPDGTTMTDSRWNDPAATGLVLALHGEQELLVLLNNGPQPQQFVVPDGTWTIALRTDDAHSNASVSGAVQLIDKSLMVLVAHAESGK
jgi:isoamylase